MGAVGKIDTENTIMDVWNNERMQYLRKAVLDNQLHKVCNFKYCPIAIGNESIDLESIKNDDPNFNNVIDQIMVGKTILDSYPSTFEVANSCKCNLKCIMCVSNQKLTPKEELLDERLFNIIIPEILPKISNLFLSGNGEVLFNAHSRKFLQTLDSSRYPSLKIQLLTNGIMFNSKIWDSISHNNYEDISVSIDAASKGTYERIRKNGNWEILLKNLEFIADLRRNNIFKKFTISFIVMKSNYKEMNDFAELGLRLGCDGIVFQKIFGYENIRENINFTQNMGVFSEIAEILTDPIFNCKGVDTKLVDDYKQYLGNTSVTRFSEYKTKWIESILYTPIKSINALLKEYSSIRTLLRRKRVRLTK